MPNTRDPSINASYFSSTVDDLLTRLRTSRQGLTTEEALKRRREFGSNDLVTSPPPTRRRVLWAQVKSPLVLLLVVAALVSAFSGEWVDAAIVLTIVSASVLLGYSREFRAQANIAALQERVTMMVSVMRDARVTSLPLAEVVPGDVVLLAAGSLVPADARLLEATDLFVTQSVLTGESFPVEKRIGDMSAGASVSEQNNCVFRGTHVRTGTARCVVAATGKSTHFGQISDRLRQRAPETEFDRGLRHLGYVLFSTMFVIAFSVFAVDVFLKRPLLETLLFSIALAVGLSPELLPAILSINLAAGAQAMASHGVLVRRLSAIENLGSMDVLCTDKTGTLTEGIVSLEGAYDSNGNASPGVLELACLNAQWQSGLANPLDEALVRCRPPASPQAEKLGEIPYDFTRKRLSVVVRVGGETLLISKGAFEQVASVCTSLDASSRQALQKRFEEWSRAGARVLGVAYRRIEARASYSREDEQALVFAGFLVFADRPKEGVRETLADLARLGVSVKVITGDSRLVAEHVADSVGLGARKVLTGRQLDEMRDEALWHQAENTDLFVEVDPNQKERIILALKKMGHVVGFMGDGVNDAPAMHAADTSISVDQAADVAKEAADFVLLEKRLDVVRRGIEEGRRTFANTLKYILTTTSANLGNMVSMAVASFFLPFLPLLAGQVLLNNFLSDIPAIGLAGDSVDPELVQAPRRLNLKVIARFMVAFGLLSSLFDAATFAVLIVGFKASVQLFRTGWFLESVLSELAIALVVRTRRRFYASRPGRFLLHSTWAVALVSIALPYSPLATGLGFVAMPWAVLAAMVAITGSYVIVTETAKGRLAAMG